MNFLYQAFKNDSGLLWVIFLLGVVAVIVFFERLFNYHRCSINVRDFIQGVFNNLKRENIVETVSICDDTPGPVAHMTRQAILRSPLGVDEMEKAVDEVSYIEIARLESRVNIIATIAQVAPVAGLLGTVVGMISAFSRISESGSRFVNLSDLAPGIAFSLVTTAAGLCVAAFAYIAYNFLVSKVQRIIHEMEVVRGEVTFFLKQHPIELSSVEGITSERNSFADFETISTTSDDAENDDPKSEDDKK